MTVYYFYRYGVDHLVEHLVEHLRDLDRRPPAATPGPPFPRGKKAPLISPTPGTLDIFAPPLLFAEELLPVPGYSTEDYSESGGRYPFRDRPRVSRRHFLFADDGGEAPDPPDAGDSSAAGAGAEEPPAPAAEESPAADPPPEEPAAAEPAEPAEPGAEAAPPGSDVAGSAGDMAEGAPDNVADAVNNWSHGIGLIIM